MTKILAVSMLLASSMWAGALTIQTENPSGNRQAQEMHAVLVARVTACREPAKSVVVASYLQLHNGKTRRTSLDVVPLKEPGTFAILGNIPDQSVIDLAVSNPGYENYRPQVLIRKGANGVEWSIARRFFQTPPSDSEMDRFLLASN